MLQPFKSLTRISSFLRKELVEVYRRPGAFFSLVLGPFLREAAPDLLPGMVLIEDTRGQWRTNVFALLEARGYTVVARSRQNVALRRG